MSCRPKWGERERKKVLQALSPLGVSEKKKKGGTQASAAALFPRMASWKGRINLGQPAGRGGDREEGAAGFLWLSFARDQEHAGQEGGQEGEKRKEKGKRPVFVRTKKKGGGGGGGGDGVLGRCSIYK